MAAATSSDGFAQKLDWLKTTFKVTDGEIGAAVGASDSLVCRWRKGERRLDRVRDASVINNLACFFAGRTEQIDTLARVLQQRETDITEKNEAYRSAFVGFLYTANPIPSVVDADLMTNDNPARQDSFFGVDGLVNVLALLEQHMKGVPTEITVYLSLEHSRIVREATMEKVWGALWRMGNGNPVRLVFDNWTDAYEATNTLRGLLPFMQSGRLRFNLVKSTQKFFYSTISVYAEGIGIIVTTEPVGGMGESVSVLIESPEYIKSMGGVFARFDKNTKAVEKHLNISTPKDEAVYFGQLFEPDSDLKTVIDGANLLYLDSDAYMDLLKLNGVTGSQRAYRLDRFSRDKKQYEAFLESNRVIEVFNLMAFDRMIATQEVKTPDFSFQAGAVKANADILKNLFTGMLNCLERNPNLSIFLNRRSLPYSDFSCRLKGDSFVLLHSYANGMTHAVYSETWLLVYEYIRQFDEVVQDKDLVTTSDAVKAAIKIRIERLGGL